MSMLMLRSVSKEVTKSKYNAAVDKINLTEMSLQLNTAEK
jgi:hypothetical protein